MHRSLFCGASLAALLLAAPGWAADVEAPSSATTVSDVVVTATLDDSGVKRELIGGSVSVITADDLEQRGTRLVADVLRDVPGIAVSRAGCAGCFTQIRIRGAEANHTLILVDGINYANPVSREADFAGLLSEDGARIEVLRGQQSSLYGSEAIGGVIQYFSPDGRSSPGARVRLEGGSFGSVAGGASFGGSNDTGDVIASFSGYDTKGTEDTRSGTRDLGYWNYTLSAKAHYAFSDNVRFNAVVRADRSRSQFNSATNAQGVLLDSPGDFGRLRNYVGRAELQGDALDGRWTNSLSVEGLAARSYSFSFGSPFISHGKRAKAAYVTAITFGDDHIKHKLTGSVDYQHETFEQNFDPAKHTLNTTGIVGVYDLTVDDNTAFGASVRNDSNNRFKSFTSYRVQATHTFAGGTRIRAAAGSGIQYPTQFELFGFSGTFRANSGLKPEKSEGWEVGVEQRFAEEGLLIGATYFHNRLTQKISSTGFPITTPINLTGKAHQEGLEVFLESQFDGPFQVDASYTRLDSKDGVPPKRTVRRAKDIASVNLNWTGFGDKLRLNVNARYNGPQSDNAFLFAAPFVQAVRLPAFTVVNVNAQYALNDTVTVFARADNLFDDTYEEIFAYRSPGREVTLGAKARF